MKASKKNAVSVVPSAPKSGKLPKASKRKFDGDWKALPSTRQLLALAIRAFETGEHIPMPATRDDAKRLLGYE